MKNELLRFREPLMMPGGYNFDYVGTLKLIDLYLNSKFQTGDKDNRGFRKFFYNIVKPACDVASKFIDLDTKDVMLYAEVPDQETKVWLMQHDLKQWLKDNNFGTLLNEIGERYPEYGSVVLKKAKKNFYNVNLQNLRFDPAAKSLNDSDFVYEINLMTWNEMQKMPWDKKAMQDLYSEKEVFYEIYECYTQQAKGKKWKKEIKAACFYEKTQTGELIKTTEAKINDATYESEGTLLYSTETDDLPYRELHWEKIPGRWLGRGVVEYLFDNQIRRNEIVNIKAKGLIYTSLKLFQTKDDTIGKNILTDVENGDIIKAVSEITPVINEERNLGAYRDEEQSWDMNTERKTFTSDITRGGDLPSRTPLGVANLQAGMAASYFDLKRETYGLFVKDLILKDVIPDFLKAMASEHNLAVMHSAEGVEKFLMAVVQAHIDAEAYNYALNGTGFFPSKEMRDAETERLIKEFKKTKGVGVKIPDNFYSDAKYILDVNVTGEQLDSGAKSQTLQVALQSVATNPQVLQDKGLRTVFFKILELQGISPIDLNLMQEAVENNPPQIPQVPGGSVGVPRAVPGQMMTNQQMG